MRILALLIVLIFLIITSLLIGVEEFNLSGVWHNDTSDLLLLQVSRLPRTLALLLAGVGISIAGLVMQLITQNKFVSPTTSGTLDAAKLGILLTILLLPEASPLLKTGITFAVTFLSNIIFILIVIRIRYKSNVFIPIIGIVYGGIIYAITAFFGYQFNIIQDIGSTQDSAGAWMMGDFSSILKGNYELLYLILPTVAITYVYTSKFTIIGVGNTFAKNLGINYELIMLVGIFCVSLTVSAVVVTVGIIPFLGLVVPNVVSLFFGDNLQKSLPITALAGAIFLLFCDLVSRLLIFPYEVPIGMTVGLLGGTIFFLLLMTRKA